MATPRAVLYQSSPPEFPSQSPAWQEVPPGKFRLLSQEELKEKYAKLKELSRQINESEGSDITSKYKKRKIQLEIFENALGITKKKLEDSSANVELLSDIVSANESTIKELSSKLEAVLRERDLLLKDQEELIQERAANRSIIADLQEQLLSEARRHRGEREVLEKNLEEMQCQRVKREREHAEEISRMELGFNAKRKKLVEQHKEEAVQQKLEFAGILQDLQRGLEEDIRGLQKYQDQYFSEEPSSM